MYEHVIKTGSPCLLYCFLVALAGHICYVLALCASQRLVRDVAHKQEIGTKPAHAQLGHVCQGLADAAAEQEGTELFVEAGDIAVSHEGVGMNVSEADPVALAQSDLKHTESTAFRDTVLQLEQDSIHFF